MFLYIVLAFVCCDEAMWCSVTPACVVRVWYADLLISHPFSDSCSEIVLQINSQKAKKYCDPATLAPQAIFIENEVLGVSLFN